MPSQKRLRELFDYNAATGILSWKKSPAYRIKDGARAGYYSPTDNSFTVGVDYRRYPLHRIIWVYTNGPISKRLVIDHIDHDASNNRLNNLRLVTRRQNHQNLSLRATNKSGAAGVYWHKQRKRWTSQIRIQGIRTHLGLFDTVNEAKAAYEKAKLAAGYHPNHGRVLQFE